MVQKRIICLLANMKISCLNVSLQPIQAAVGENIVEKVSAQRNLWKQGRNLERSVELLKTTKFLESYLEVDSESNSGLGQEVIIKLDESTFDGVTVHCMRLERAAQAWMSLSANYR